MVIARNMKKTQTDLLDEYKSYLKLPKDDERYCRYDTIPIGYRQSVEEFFENRSEEAIKMDFNRKYKFVKDNLISNIRLNFPRKFFEQYPSHIILLKNITTKEKVALYNLFREEKPPFRVTCEVLDEGIYIFTSLPPYYDSRLSYLFLSTFSKFKTYSMDFFGDHGVAYPFYAENFNPQTHSWRDDIDWMYNLVFKRIDEKLNNGNFAEGNNGS